VTTAIPVQILLFHSNRSDTHSKFVQKISFFPVVQDKIVNIAIPVVTTLIINAWLVRFLEDTHGSVSLDHSLPETMSYNDSGISDD
jgi:hypothetical protein